MTAWFLGLAIKSTLLLFAVAGVAAGMRRSPAAARHFVWLSGLVSLLLLPLLALSGPAWSPAWLGGWLPKYLLMDAPGVVVTVPEASLAAAGSSVVARPSLDAGAKLGAGISDRAGSSVPTGERGPAGSSDAAFWLALVWVAGAFAMTGWLAVGFVRRTRLACHAVTVHSGPMFAATIATARLLGVRRGFRLILGSSRLVPMTWGVVRSVLFLPAAAERWSERRLNAVLLHELAHIKRHDSLSRLLAQLACCVFWFHPLVWLSARRMLREQERACDDVVILAGANPHHYAETLVAIARQFHAPRPNVAGALAFSRRSNLEHRVLSILDPLERRKKVSLFRKVALLVLFVGVGLPLAALQPVVGAQEPDVVAPIGSQSEALPQSDVQAQRPPDRSVDASGRFVLEAEGVTRIGRNVAGVELAEGGWLVITEELQRLEIRPSAGGDLDVAYSVNGTEADFDDEARRWADEILSLVSEIGGLGGNLFVSMSRAEMGVGLPVLELEPFEIAVEPVDLKPLEDALLSAESFIADFEQMELVPEFWAIDLTLEQQAELVESFDISLEQQAEMAESFEVAIDQMELSTEWLETSLLGEMELAESLVTLEELELAVEPLVSSFETLELATEFLAESIELLDPTLEMTLAETRGDFRVRMWSEGGSRFVVVWRGEVDLGETVDEIDVGERGELFIDESSADGVHRRLRVFADDNGEIAFEWNVDGEATAFDPDGRAWLQQILDWLNEDTSGNLAAY